MHETRPIGIGDVDWVVLTPESKPERLAQFRSDNPHLDFEVEVMPATEGSDVDLRELAEIDLISREAVDWDREAVGNALTHWLCWHQAVETQRPVGVLQDNAVTRSDFVPRVRGLLEAAPAGWEFMQLGYNTQSGIDFMITPDCRYRGMFTRKHARNEDLKTFTQTATAVVPMRMHNAFGAFAYIITPAAAQKLIDRCFPLATAVVYVPCLRGRIRTTSIDGVMNQFYGDLQAYVSFPPLALTRAEPPPKVLHVDVVVEPAQ